MDEMIYLCNVHTIYLAMSGSLEPLLRTMQGIEMRSKIEAEAQWGCWWHRDEISTHITGDH